MGTERGRGLSKLTKMFYGFPFCAHKFKYSFGIDMNLFRGRFTGEIIERKRFCYLKITRTVPSTFKEVLILVFSENWKDCHFGFKSTTQLRGWKKMLGIIKKRRQLLTIYMLLKFLFAHCLFVDLLIMMSLSFSKIA